MSQYIMSQDNKRQKVFRDDPPPLPECKPVVTKVKLLATMFTDLSEIFGVEMQEYCKNTNSAYCTTLSMVGCDPLHSNLWHILGQLQLSMSKKVYIPDWFIQKYDQREDHQTKCIKDNYYQAN